MDNEFQVSGHNLEALFTLKLYRGEGMALLAMNWRNGKPTQDFVGFAIEYKEPDGQKYFSLKNRLGFLESGNSRSSKRISTRLAPIQKFRWVHFPRNAELTGEFVYRVTPVFMNDKDELSYGEYQEAKIELKRETYPKTLNVAFTRGFVSSQAFVDRYQSKGDISTILPKNSTEGLTFKPTHPQAGDALAWMGFEARDAIIEVLDLAIKDPGAKVSVIAFDLNEPGIVSRLEKLGPRLRIIIDDSKEHLECGSGENQAAELLSTSAGHENVKRQHVRSLQHNKMIIVNSSTTHIAVCGSTNFSWRGFFVQANNAVILQGKNAIKTFQVAFENYWTLDARGFENSISSEWNDLKLQGIEAYVAFSPHMKSNALLQTIADDIDKAVSSLFFSLAFLYQTKGAIRNSIENILNNDKIFVYGISDKKLGGLDLQKPNGNIAPVFPAALTKNVPEPFSAEPTGGMGIRMHHKFVVIDFNKPTARVYLGSYNFSSAADTKNGENLLLIKDRRIAVAYVVEAIRIIDHYHFRVAQKEARNVGKILHLSKPPRAANEKPWWDEDYSNAHKILDRELFS